jgi:tetratricopeptide (TPR) repeat protein
VETPLEPEEALALLQALCGEKVDAVSLRRVQDLLGGHPLALTWAGSQLAAGGESPRAFVTALAAASLPDLHQPGDEHRTLRWLYNRSVSRLTQEAQRVLAAAGLLAQQPFPLSAAATVLENEERTARLALKSLVQHSLLRLSNRTDEEWEFTHALAHRFAHATGDTTLLNALGVWTVTYFESAAEKARRTGDLSLLGRALNHATALLRADHETNIFTAVQNFLLYDGLKQIWMLGRVDFARITIEAVHAWLECARTRQPHDAALQREQSVSYNNLGRVAVAAGQLEAARRAYEQSLAIRERLATADPSNSQWQRDLSVSYNNLGRVAVAAGQLEAARRAYEQSLAIAERLATTDPSNSEWQRDLSVSYMSIGSLLTRQHQPSDALAFLEKAQAISARLTQHDPVNAVWRNDLAWILNRIAAVQSDHFRPSWRQRTRTWVQRRLAALRERGAKETK